MVEATGDVANGSAARGSTARWTVGLDGSECSRHAALWAAAQATGRATELQLASTWSVPVSTSTHTVGQGGAAALLLAAAHNSELLVVGSRGRGGFARLVLGSTSTQCATHSTTPVAVIPSTSPIGPVASIAVAFDGSPNSINALAWAIDFAAPGSTIDCVSVWDTTPVVVGGDQFLFPEASGLARDRLEHLFAQAVATHERDDVELTHLFVEGSTRMALAEHAERVDLLVMGARGHGAIGAMLLGSVSTWLLHHVKRPMVVVPHGVLDVDDTGDDERD